MNSEKAKTLLEIKSVPPKQHYWKLNLALELANIFDKKDRHRELDIFVKNALYNHFLEYISRNPGCDPSICQLAKVIYDSETDYYNRFDENGYIKRTLFMFIHNSDSNYAWFIDSFLQKIAKG